MKHIALLLAILIFAFSAISCGDLTYYADTGWRCPREEFSNKYYDPITAKIVAVAEAHDLDLIMERSTVASDHFVVLLYDNVFTFRVDMISEELWGTCEFKFYFLNSDEAKLWDYNAQKKYIDFAYEVTSLIAYGVDENIYENAFKSCISNGRKTFEAELHFDAMTGDEKYGLVLCDAEYDGNHIIKSSQDGVLKGNYYYFMGFIGGDIDSNLAS